MTKATATQEKLYSLYCDYVTQSNIHVQAQYASLAGIRVLSEQEFEAVWKELSASSQAIWREKFEMGYERVAEAHRKLIENALLSGQTLSRCSGTSPAACKSEEV